MATKKRQSNIELCRLASILLVMVLHTTYQSLGTDVNLGVCILEGFTLIGVNVFVLITGYFSTTPKVSSLLNLAFICLFWMIIKVFCRDLLGQELSYKYAFFITSSNWFIASYIFLLLLTPILNCFCNSVSKRMLLGGVILLLLAEIYFDWLPPTPSVRIGVQNGYSVLSFVILYLLARAIRLHGLPQWFMKLSPLIYIVCSIVVGLMIYLVMHTGHENVVEWPMAYTNPLLILSSVSFLMMFGRLSFQSGFVNHIAKSTLACLLGHSAIFFLYTKQFKYLYDHFSGFEVVVYWILAVAIVFVSSILIDQLRLLIWKPLERYFKRKIKNDNIYELATLFNKPRDN